MVSKPYLSESRIDEWALLTACISIASASPSTGQPIRPHQDRAQVAAPSPAPKVAVQIAWRSIAGPKKSRLSMNTSTRIRVDFAESQRTVKVERGEVLFEVAKDASRPFVVQAAGTEVVATGTAFLVQASLTAKPGDQALAVTLVEGQVVVRSAAGEGRQLERPLVMVPGQRLRLSRSDEAQRPATATRVDRPQMDQVLAWRRGEARFDNVSLLEAVNEMNRYDRVVIVVSGMAGEKRVSGVVKTGDNASFAEAMAILHGLVIRNHGDRLELVQP